MTKKLAFGMGLSLAALLVGSTTSARAGEARLVRYPHYSHGKVAFTYMGDIWTADETGKNIQRLTANKARDFAPRFSPDGKQIAFSSDRERNLDVWVMPAEGGAAKQLTFHSADDTVLGWSPDGKSILFASSRGEDFLGTLYTVPVAGGPEVRAGTDFGMYGGYSPDGTKLAVNRKGQSYWRKGYRGSYQTDVTVLDLKSKSFKHLTDFPGMDTWPMWSTDGFIYFVSDRDDKSQANVWRVPQDGGKAERVTEFKDGDVRFPAISTDGKTIVFERDFRLWKLDLASKKAVAIKLEINAEPQETLAEFRAVSGEVDDYDVAPTGKTAIVSVRGDLFAVPTGDDGEVVQITKGAPRDRDIEFSPDSRTIAFVSDKEPTREEIFTAPADGSSEPKRLTDIDSLKSSFVWSPDSKSIAITTSDGKLYRIAATGGPAKKLLESKYGSLGRPTWSPDGSLLAISMEDVTRTEDIYILPSEGGEPKKVTFDTANDRNPRFSADGKKLYFIRSDMSDFSSGGFAGLGGGGGSGLMVIPLEKQDKDPNEPADTSPEGMAGRMGGGGRPGMAGPGGMPGPGGAGGAAVSTPKPPKIDWAGLKRRTRPVMASGGGGSSRGGAGGGAGRVMTYTPGIDGRTIIFASGGGGGGAGGGLAGLLGGGGISIYSCTDDGKNVRQIAGGSTPTATPDEDGPRGRGFGGGRGGIGNLRLTRDGRTVFYQEGNAVYSASTGSGGGGGAAGLAAMMGGGRMGGMRGPAAGTAAPSGDTGGGSRKKLDFNVSLAIEKPEEWQEVFSDAWRCMKYRFYDPKLHGIDWDAARLKYEPIVAHVADRHELVNLINEMIGELNASHTGASVGGARSPGDTATAPPIQTLHLGFDVEPDAKSGLYKVSYIYEDSPVDKDWIKISVGDYLISLDGQAVKTSDDLWKILTNRRLNKKAKVVLNSKPVAEGAWTLKYEPISWSNYSEKRYDRWVKDRREAAEKLSGGRVGYLHIKAMDQPSLRKFEKDLRDNRHKEALVIDQRFNGGGNIEQELLAILVQKPYQVWHPRDSEPTNRPFRGYFGPKVVLQNWRSASNAEMFPAGFRSLGLGKVIGTPTMGAVIGTGSYSLIDGTQIRTPGVGVYLADTGRTNMENYGVQPDIEVENTPEDNLSGRDRQLEVAVQELLKQLPGKPATDAAGGGAGH